MAEQSGPKKETVRIAAPSPATSEPAVPGGGDTVRLDPAPAPSPPQPPIFRPPPAPVRPSVSEIPKAPAAPPDLPPRVSPPIAGNPPNYSTGASQARPKKETARISAVPEAPRPSINMKK